MKKLISNKKTLLLLMLFFINSCNDSTSSTKTYTIDDIVGTWKMQSYNMDISISMDLNVALSSLEESDCGSMGGSYINDSCTLSEDIISLLTTTSCDAMDGEISGTICTLNLTEQFCCSDSESQILTITSDGSMTMVNTNNGQDETIMGTISIDGIDILWSLNNSPELSGIISLLGNTATLEFSLHENNVLAVLDSDEVDESFVNAIDSVTGKVVMVMEKVDI